MSEIDAAELATFREKWNSPWIVEHTVATETLLSLIDALEKARGAGGVLRLRAERDSARALLRECRETLGVFYGSRMDARIAKELAQ